MPRVYTPFSKYAARQYYWRSFKKRFAGMFRDIKGIITNKVQK